MENQALQVRGNQNIHGRTRRHLKAPLLVINLSLEEVGQDIVFIRCADQLANWQTDLLGIVGRQDITKVPCRNW